MSKILRLLVAAGVAFVVPFVFASAFPDGMPLWPVCAVIAVAGGWWAGRQNQWESDPDLDPWEKGVPLHLRWMPAVSSIGVAVVAAGTAIAMGLTGAAGAADPATGPVATVAPADTVPETTSVAPVNIPSEGADGSIVGTLPPDETVPTTTTIAFDEEESSGTLPPIQAGMSVPVSGDADASNILTGYGWEPTSLIATEAGVPILDTYTPGGTRQFVPARYVAAVTELVNQWATGTAITAQDGYQHPAPAGVTGVGFDTRSQPGAQIIVGGSDAPLDYAPDQLSVIVVPIYQCADDATDPRCGNAEPLLVSIVNTGAGYELAALRGAELG